MNADLPITHEDWEKNRALMQRADLLEYVRLPEEIVEGVANWLLLRLYRPDGDRGAVFDSRRAPPGVATEAINWGDLAARVDGHTGDGRMRVVLEEAEPGSNAVAGYVSGWLRAWGWDVEVSCEW